MHKALLYCFKYFESGIQVTCLYIHIADPSLSKRCSQTSYSLYYLIMYVSIIGVFIILVT